VLNPFGPQESLPTKKDWVPCAIKIAAKGSASMKRLKNTAIVLSIVDKRVGSKGDGESVWSPIPHAVLTYISVVLSHFSLTVLVRNMACTLLF